MNTDKQINNKMRIMAKMEKPKHFDFWNEIKNISKIIFYSKRCNKMNESFVFGQSSRSSVYYEIPFFYLCVICEDVVTTYIWYIVLNVKQQRVKKGVKNVRWLQFHYISLE